MTGIGEAGLVISLIPLLVSTAEHYGDIMRPIRRWRNVSVEARRFQQKVTIQESIYKTECELLFWNVSNHEIATAVLKNKAGFEQQKALISAELERRFGRSAEAYVAVVDQIRTTLDRINNEHLDLDRKLSDSNDIGSSSMEEGLCRRVNLKKRLKFSISGSRLDEMCVKLRSLNDDLQRISSQIFRISERESRDTKSLQSASDMIKYREIAAASEGLHQALRKACTKHTMHTAYLSVSTSHLNAAQIQFNLSFTHLSVSTTNLVEGLCWFNVGFTAFNEQSKPSGASASRCDNSLIDLTYTLKRQRSPPATRTPKKLRINESSRSSLPTRPCNGNSATSESSSSVATSDDPIPQLYMQKNFCDRIKHCFEANSCDMDAPIGLLDECKDWKQIVYPPSKKPGCQPTASLAEIISLLSQGSRRLKLPKRDRIHFARLLATAILQFYKTAWLADSWRGEDVVFFDLDITSKPQVECIKNKCRASEVEHLPTPYLNSQVACLDNESQTPQQTQFHLAPCEVLFRLGVIMLELAHKAPLNTLQLPCDLGGGSDTRYVEFFAARRLGEPIDNNMGCTYGKIVRQCLQCDFGRGNDFGDPRLQAAFHEEVVCELQKLEDGFRKLQLGGRTALFYRQHKSAKLRNRGHLPLFSL